MYEREREIARQRATAILAQFNNRGDAPPAMNLAPELIQPNAYRWGCRVESIPRYPKDVAVLLIHPGDPLMSSIWAVKDVENYDYLFKQFLRVAYGLEEPRIPPELDIDHLRAKAVAAPSTMIRLEMVDEGPNRSHGSGIEKRTVKSIVTKGREKRDHTPGSMSWVVALKLAGVLSPVIATSNHYEARLEAAVDYFRKAGWPEETVRAGLEDLIALADRR